MLTLRELTGDGFGKKDRSWNEPELLLEKKPLQTLAADGELGIFHHEGFWMGMDTFRDWKELNGLWDDGRAEWKIWDD